MLRNLWGLLAHTALAIMHRDWTKEPAPQRKIRYWIFRKVHNLQYNPRTQWLYHLRMSWFWVANFPIVTAWLIGWRASWGDLGVYYVALLSIYANFVSDYTGVHAAWAALRGDQIRLRQEIDDGHIITEIISNGPRPPDPPDLSPD